MSEKCIKTGAWVYLDEWGIGVHGDLFITPQGTYILHCNYPWKQNCREDGIDRDFEAQFWKIAYERDGTIVADACDVTQSPAFTTFRAKWG